MRSVVRLLVASLALTATALLGASAALQAELQDPDLAPNWIYDDLPAARAQARETGKPLFVTLRCVPCPAGGPMDAAITHPTGTLAQLEQQFVCVRLIKNQGLDMRLFQFDHDQSWTAFFLNADGTIYGRYGTRAGNAGNSDTYLTVPSVERAMTRALALHAGFPGNRAALAAKLGKEPAYPRAELIPGLMDRAVEPVTKKQCIHCHMVREQLLTNRWTAGQLRAADLYCYPLPTTIGLTMNVDDGLAIDGVTADSPAARAGLAAGDELIGLNGQPLLSIADIQWVLNSVPDETQLVADVRRAGVVAQRTVQLAGNWREADLGWRTTSWGVLRHGLLTAPLTAEEKQARGIPAASLALLVKQLYGKAQQVLPKAGLKPKDVILAVDGKTHTMSESAFLVDLRLTHGPRDTVRLGLLRGTERLELTVPMW